ncbi:MAG TPA: hypothetical protein QGF35_04210, partial [Dehalococcoidia bacterium]|nr:hypothetical protein [Dehalococcoidia bacterium]
FVWGNRKQPAQDGPAQYGHGWVPRVWLLITGGLAAFVMVWPGLTGLAALQSEYTAAGWGSPEARLTVDVEAQQWAFTYRFFEGICPESLQEEILEEAPGLISEPVERSGCSMVAVVFPSTTEGNFNLIKVPAGEEVKFEIQSLDVLHSFWIPAFRTKIDAIPGRITYMTIEPTIFGSYTNDAAYRVQCAELCGADHTIMRSNIEVVDRDAFDEWIRSVQKDGQ